MDCFIHVDEDYDRFKRNSPCNHKDFTNSKLFYLKIRMYLFFILKIMSRIFASGQNGITGTGSTLLPETTKNQKIPETMVLKTLNIYQ